MTIIRTAVSADADVIARFNQAMAIETEDKSLDASTITNGVRRMIEDDALGFYLVNESDGLVTGCLGVTFEWSDWRNGLFWWIQSVFIDPEARAQGIFSAMYAEVKRRALLEKDVCGIRLYAEKDNERAIRTYERLGMITTHYRILEEEL